ncbi:unnamed protein product [Trifolium pratense]|uniref:Uncharacterized protein n=1 Tax=Trifolium pratense TaxID=57577 RepID=A0ACB0KKI2_TRIPR|nr:unnamed protein product [Trifolium pratense]
MNKTGRGGKRKLTMSIYLSRLFPRSNSSLFLCNGKALQSKVLRLGKEMFMVDAGPGTPRNCMQEELTKLQECQSTEPLGLRIRWDSWIRWPVNHRSERRIWRGYSSI